MSTPPTWDLRAVPLDALVAECRRRGHNPLARLLSEDVAVGSLLLRSGRRQAVWRGETVALRPREHDLLAALCRAHPHSRTVADLATAVYGGASKDDVNNVRVYFSFLRRKLPGLIATSSRALYPARKTYWLDVEQPQPPRLRVVGPA